MAYLQRDHMHGTRSTLTKKRERQSAVTSGRRVFAKMDGLDLRTAHAMRFRDLIRIYTRDAGGDAKITESQRALIRDIALLQCQLEDMQAEYAQTGKFAEQARTEYQRIGNSMRRHMRDVGLTGVKSRDDDDAELDPLQYAERGGARPRRERLEDEDE
ncbi:hypothetical protein [Bradyrhizobium diazoefficiens]|uniref:hypothetical protein n=1 Tax=Bradyrhizobium diazoefficiens TaxID=1355477 RepID=UPI00348A8D86